MDLYGRPLNIINIEIEDNDNLPPKYDIYLKNFYKINTDNDKDKQIDNPKNLTL